LPALLLFELKGQGEPFGKHQDECENKFSDGSGTYTPDIGHCDRAFENIRSQKVVYPDSYYLNSFQSRGAVNDVAGEVKAKDYLSVSQEEVKLLGSSRGATMLSTEQMGNVGDLYPGANGGNLLQAVVTYGISDQYVE
jgi:hypothetical protein